MDNAENLNLVMPMYHLLEYSSDYSDTKSSLQFHSEVEATDFNNDIMDTNHFKSYILKYNAKLLEDTEVNPVNGILRNNNCYAIKILQ